MRLVLFDIDGTLVDCGRQTRPLFAQALDAVYGTTGEINGYDFAGRTDTGIVFDVLGAAGVEHETVEAGLVRMRQVYCRLLDERLKQVRLLPGVVGLLEELTAAEEVCLGLLTGNWEDGARIKLDRAGLNRFFRCGAFGEGQPDRNALPPVALVQAIATHRRVFAPDEALVVGDTVHDVACARAHGLACLAVATGSTSARQLGEAGADWVVDDLTGVDPRHPAFR